MTSESRPASGSDQAREAENVQTKVSVQLSEQWLLERTYHAQLLNGKELSVVNLTEAMKQLIDFPVPISSQSAESRLPERPPTQKSSSFFVPISAWQEITQKEAQASYQQGNPILLYSEHTWEHELKTTGIWGHNRNMGVMIYGNKQLNPDAISGTEYAVCYLDARQGIFSNASWKRWFSSDPAILFESHDQPVTFLCPYTQFPFTTHYTVVASDGRVSEYPGRAEAVQGFAAAPLQEEQNGDAAQAAAPHFSYYNEFTLPSGTYRLEFFGPRMNEQGYRPVNQPLAVTSA